ncbi:SRPBCC family protein [Streptomyces bambusae]|uniref:SRPBCC family protein n=1 Tax=Streptomyces bambusae TaxID=1550616 RepID=UPI001CFED885|nr:SRPBCC family protein [Streptomyces bambusae]MCB5168959.1 SRPBCC family protein [Streptomyces bambusae]
MSAAIKETIEISRTPADVFAYMTDLRHMPEWQESAVAATPLGEGPPAVGSRVQITRQMAGRKFPMTMEITELDPPRSWHLHSVGGGPVEGDVQGTIEPLDGGTRSRVTLDLHLEGHGLGKAFVPLVVRPHARKEMPRNEARLKDLLEH